MERKAIIEKVPSPYEVAVLALQSNLVTPLGIDPQTDITHMKAAVSTIAAHWLVKKKWNSKHRIPGPRTLAKQLEPLGELLFRELDLCIQCHALQGQLPYRNAAEWFALILRQGRKSFSRYVWEKGDFLVFHSRISGCLRRRENPFCPEKLKELLPPDFEIKESLDHLQRLVAVSFELADSSDLFRKDYWNPYTKAYTRWRKSVGAEEMKFPKVEGENPTVSYGSGHGRFNFYPNRELVSEILATWGFQALNIQCNSGGLMY